MCEELKSWAGAPIEEIISESTKYTSQQTPKIEISQNHTILFKLPLPVDDQLLPIPAESEEPDKWDDDHVRLPCNSQSTYKEIDDNEEIIAKSRWELIEATLRKSIKSSRELENAIKTYNNKYEKSWNFTTLHQLFDEEFSDDDGEHFFNEILPKLIELALMLPILIKTPIPFLKQKMNHSISLSQQQAACLLANGFLCTFPNRSKRNSDYPEINFNRLYGSHGSRVISKLKCVLNYFQTILIKSMPTGVLTFQRRFIDQKDFPDWKKSDAKLSDTKWHISSLDTIEEGERMLQVDFANRYLGGGVLGGGCVQEEIRFMLNIECITGMLFCESMKAEEAIYIYGSKQFSDYEGYASTFKWAPLKKKVDDTPRDEYRRKLTHIVAIDAISFRIPSIQFQEFFIRRDLNKAYCGFFNESETATAIATGNWGCGAFQGYNRLKCLIQLMACCVNRRPMVYYTFHDIELMLDMEGMFRFLQENQVTIAQLWKYITSFKEKHNFNLLYHHIREQFQIEKESKGIFDCLFDPEELGREEQLNVEVDNAEKVTETCEENQTDYEALEKPTKRMKIDEADPCEEEEENSKQEDTANTEDDMNNRKITDYFCKISK